MSPNRLTPCCLMEVIASQKQLGLPSLGGHFRFLLLLRLPHELLQDLIDFFAHLLGLFTLPTHDRALLYGRILPQLLAVVKLPSPGLVIWHKVC